MKRLLLVTDIFPPDIGGPATFIERLALELSQRNVRVTVLCTADRFYAADRKRPYRVRRLMRRHSLMHRLRFRFTLAWEVWRSWISSGVA